MYNRTTNRGEQMSSIFITINDTTGFMEMIFDNLESAQAWCKIATEIDGDTYTIEEEDAC